MWMQMRAFLKCINACELPSFMTKFSQFYAGINFP